MTEEEIQTFEDCVEDALMREEPKKDEVDLWLDRLTPEQLAFVAWVSDAHPVDVAQEIECEIDAEMEAYRAMRKQQAEETLKNPDGSWKPFRSWASYPRKRLAPLPADEANFYGAYE